MLRLKFASSDGSSEPLAAGDRLPVMLVAMGLVALPLLKPKGPGHMAPVDVVIGAASLLALVWAASVRARVRVPYVVPMAVLVVAGAIGGIAGNAPDRAVVAIGQDLFLLVWAAAIATVARTPAAVRTLLSAWAWSAAGWATILVGATGAHLKAVSGVSGFGHGRARFTFDHPNLAASYFVVSLFVVLIAKRPQHPLARAGAILMLLAAIALTGSNAALIGLGVGAIAYAAVAVTRRRDAMAGLATLSAACLVVAFMAHLATSTGAAQAVERSDNPLIRYSVARGDRSMRDRVELFRTEMALFEEEPYFGRGPASTRSALDELGEGAVKEAHNDYLATLVERGPLGVVGLLALMLAVGLRLTSTGSRSLAPRFARAVPGVAAFIGAAAVLAVSAATHEVLHYRHVWALFGFLAALHAWGRAAEPGRGGRP